MKYSVEDLNKELKSIKNDLKELDSGQLKYRINIKFEKLGDEKKGNKWWYTVKMSIEGDSDIMNQIDKVEYRLHPTFKPQIISSNDRKSGFPRKIKIWGFFTVRATVHLQEGNIIELARFINIKKREESR